MKFLADMGISPKTVTFLSEHGYDAVHLFDEGLKRMSDPEMLQKARAEGRILLTHDLDFADLIAASGSALPSVVIFRLHRMRPELVNEHLKAIIDSQQSMLLAGVIVSVSDRSVRVRVLPLERDEA